MLDSCKLYIVLLSLDLAFLSVSDGLNVGVEKTGRFSLTRAFDDLLAFCLSVSVGRIYTDLLSLRMTRCQFNSQLGCSVD